MKIGILIPDRNDRPEFLQNCLRMINNQIVKPHIIEIVNDPPPENFLLGNKIMKNVCDITYRYRIGYERLKNKGLDIIALIENDDWYHPTYLETMLSKWVAVGKPDLLGHDYTTYYHIKEFAHFNMNHKTRSSAMNTFIKPDLNINWCYDGEAYTDLHLWLKCGLSKHIFHPEKHICLGIKHGEGFCGGVNHTTKMERYINKDIDKKFLRTVMDDDSFIFYTQYFLKKQYEAI